MRHRKHGRKLGRNTSHRKALRRNMARNIFQHGKVVTTPAKAKECRPLIEKIITMAKAAGSGDLADYRRVVAELGSRDLAKSVVHEIAPLFADRQGGYTRALKLAKRRLGDGGEQVLVSLVSFPEPEE